MRLLNWFSGLNKKGVLSLNQRNGDYILKYNRRSLYPIVDDKLKTKELAQANKLPVPPLFTVIRQEHQIAHLQETLQNISSFVIKPANGAGGDGIVVICDYLDGRYKKVSGQWLSQEDLEYHLSMGLSGAYSLGGHPDKMLIEHRVQVDPIFEEISYQGVPDIRVIVFKGYPVMAMVRLPTSLSEGKANLHQGAIGVGVTLSDGITMGGVNQNATIERHPDTRNIIAGIQVPAWQTILHMAASSYEMTELGYLGVDIVLDKDHGPLMLELNARPGLNIQIANRAGLRTRLEKVKQIFDPAHTVDERIEICKTLY